MNASSIITTGLKACITRSFHQLDPDLRNSFCNEAIKDFPCNARDIKTSHPLFQRVTKADLNGLRTTFFQQQSQYFILLKRYLRLGEKSFNAQLNSLAANLATWPVDVATSLEEMGASKM